MPILKFLAFVGLTGLILGGVAAQLDGAATRLILVLAPVAAGAFIYWKWMRNQRAFTEGTARLQQGRCNEALGIFDTLDGAWPPVPMLPVQRGLALLGLWRLEELRRTYEPLVSRPGRVQALFIFLTRPRLALACALLGDATRARELVDQQPSDPTSLLAAAVLALREKHPREACALLERKAIYQLAGPERGLRDALHAWGAHQLTGQIRHVNRVAIWGEGGPEELARAWPEFMAALERAPTVESPGGRSPRAAVAP